MKNALIEISNAFKKIQYNSPVILSFALLSFVALVIGGANDMFLTNLLFSVHRSPASDPLTYIRLFGHVLGHANFDHYLGNFLIILLIGPLLEEKYGSKNMLLMILATAFITGILNMAFSPYNLRGASGVAFMLILLSSFVNLEKGRIPATFILVVIVFLGREIRDGLIIHDNISRITHIIGGVFGMFVGCLLNREKLEIEFTSKPKKEAVEDAAGDKEETA